MIAVKKYYLLTAGYLTTLTLNTPAAGFSVALGENLTVTVFAALTQAVYVAVAVTEPFGIPSITGSPTAAPVTVMVRFETAPAAMLGKSKLADPLRVLVNV